MKRKILFKVMAKILVFVMAVSLAFVPNAGSASAAKSCKKGIYGNGTGGIKININAAPYNKMDFGENGIAYKKGGCTWFVAARVTQFLGKTAGINEGPYWWRTSNGLGLKKGQEMKAPAVLCWGKKNGTGSTHVAILEGFSSDGKRAYISEGGIVNWNKKDLTDYGCALIRECDIKRVRNRCEANNIDDFLGFVYLPGAKAPSNAVLPGAGASRALTGKSTYTTDEKIIISWDKTSNATDYRVIVTDLERKDDKKINLTPVKKYVNGTSYTIAAGALKKGNYNIEISPANTYGWGKAINKKITVTAPVTKPGKFTITEAKSQYKTGEEIKIVWSVASKSTRYKVVLKDSNNKVIESNDNVTILRYIIKKQLSPGSYTFEVTPNNSAGNGSPAKVSFTVVKPKPSAFNLTIKSQYTTNEELVISWTKPTNATVYLLSVRKLDNNGNEIGTVFNSNQIKSTSHNIGKLSAGNYRVQVTPYNTLGAGATVAGDTIKEYINVVAPESEKPSPGAFAVTVKDEYPDSEEIVINWTASSNAENYKLIIEDKDGKEIVNKEVAGTSSKIDKLPAGDYTVKMTAVNDSGSCSAADKSFTVTAAEKPTVTEPDPTEPKETDPATPTEPDETDPTEPDETDPTAPTEATEEVVPVSGDVEIELNDLGGYPSDENLEISWRGASGAQSYKAVLSLVGGKSIERSVNGESADFGKQRAGLYSLTVIPYGSSGEKGEESTVGLMVFDKPVIKCSKYSDSQGNNLKLTWNKIENAEEYAVEIIDSDSEYQVLSETTTSTSYVVNIPEGNYNIYVEAINGDYSILSDCCTYTCTEEDMEEEDDEEPELMLKVKSRTYKRNTDLKKAKSFFIKASAGKADIVYTLSTSAKKAKIKVSENGKVKVPRGCRRGKYFITVTAYGNGDDEPISKTVKIIVK